MATFNIAGQSRGYLIWLVILLTMVSMVGSFISDTYLPALPTIAEDFSTTSELAQDTITLYLLGLSFSQLLYGRCADAFGRKYTLLVGLAVALLGSLGCCLVATSIRWFILFRFIQGLGAGAGVVVARAIARDLFSGEKLAQIMSYMTLFFVIAPALAPVLGGYIQHWWDWRMIFVFMLLYILVLFIWSLCVLPETTNPTLCMNLRRWFTDYTILLKNKNFIRHCYCATAALAGFFAYYAISPFLFEEIFGVSAVDYGWLAVYIGAFSALSRFINGVLVIQYGIERVIYCGIITLVIAGVLMLGGYFLQINNVWAVLAPMILFTIGAGLIFANSFAGAMEDFASMAGTASSLYGFLQILGTFGMTWVVTKFAVHNQFVLATALLFLGVSALVVFRVLPE